MVKRSTINQAAPVFETPPTKSSRTEEDEWDAQVVGAAKETSPAAEASKTIETHGEKPTEGQVEGEAANEDKGEEGDNEEQEKEMEKEEDDIEDGEGEGKEDGEGKVDEEEDASPAQWVQCEACAKWRSCPNDVELPEGSWYCTDNKWDASHNTCDAEEEKQAEDSGEVDEEEEEETVDDYIERIRKEREEKAAEKERKKKEREEQRKIVQEERRVERMAKLQEEMETLIASWTEEERQRRKREARKKNSKKQIPIHLYTRQYGDKKATSLLVLDLLLGADVDAQDSSDRTPLHYAVMNECEEYEKLLLEKGAFPFACDISERCPEEYRKFSTGPKSKCMWDKFI